MEFINAIILGIVQGLTEFLPISSSGHLVLIQKFLGFKEHSVSLDIAVHFGTLMSVFTVYFHQIKKIAVDVILFPKARLLSLPVKIFIWVVLGSIPTAIIGFVARDVFISFFSDVRFVGLFLCLTGVILFLTRYKRSEESHLKETLHDFGSFESMSGWKALAIGLVQGLAIAPGISRSGSTIAMGLFLGLPRNVSAGFSFLLSIPAILGATLLELGSLAFNEHEPLWLNDSLWPMLTGVAVSYVVGLIGLWSILFFVRKGHLAFFSVYLWILGLWAMLGIEVY